MKKPTLNSQPRLFPNILIIAPFGEWLDRYSAQPPRRRQPDAIIQKVLRSAQGNHVRHDGEARVWRSAEVSDAEWKRALMTLTGQATYENEIVMGKGVERDECDSLS
jgi:hypothetical protein